MLLKVFIICALNLAISGDCFLSSSRLATSCTDNFIITSEGKYGSGNLTSRCPQASFRAPSYLSLTLNCKSDFIILNNLNTTCRPNDTLTIQHLDTRESYCVHKANANYSQESFLTKTNMSINIFLSLDSRDVGRGPLEFCSISAVKNTRSGRNIERALNYSRCGQVKYEVSQRILGGQEVLPNNYPWMVLLKIDDSKLCGGTIISSKFILTAAHCLHLSKQVKAYLGVHELEGKNIARNVSNMIIHPQFKFPNFDIALIELSKAIVFSENVRPVCLPKRRIQPGEVVLGLGWGKTSDVSEASDVLKENNFTVISDASCKKIYNINFDQSIMCTRDPAGQATCQGDSGSFIGRTEDDFFAQHGIVSFTANQCGQGFPSGYTEVFPFISWIKTNAKI